MYRIVIIDDEALVRVGLKSMIDWEKEDMVIVGEASNGQAGMELIRRLQPDIVITDIKMPVMNGFEMIQALSEELETVPQYVILSGYDEFEYAKTALKLSVSDYIVKLELESDILLSSLEKIKVKLADARLENGSYKKYVMAKQSDLTENFFKKIILGEINPASVQEEIEMLHLNIHMDNIFIIYVEINYNLDLRRYTVSDMNLLIFSVINISNDISNGYFNSYAIRWSECGVIIISSTESKDKHALASSIRQLCHCLADMLFQYFNIHTSMFISGYHTEFQHMPEALQECMLCRDAKQIVKGNIIFYDTAFKNAQSIKTIIRTKQYILEHYQDKIGLNDVARHLKISSAYLSSLFKKHTGKCFNEFVTEVKINEAQRLMGESEYKIYEISDMLGYASSFYFSKVFKKVTGMSPSDYMSSHGNAQH